MRVLKRWAHEQVADPPSVQFGEVDRASPFCKSTHQCVNVLAAASIRAAGA